MAPGSFSQAAIEQTADDVKVRLSELLKSSEVGFVASLRLGTRPVFLFTDGTLRNSATSVATNDKGEEVITVFPKVAVAEPGSNVVVGRVGDFTVRAGCHVVVGRGGVGKTPLVHALASRLGTYGFIRYGEPFAGYITDPVVLSRALIAGMGTQRVIVLDSIKDLLSSAGGAAMKSGLNRDILPQLSSLSIAAADLGCAVFVPVNPSSDDAEVTNLLVEAMRSNVTSVIYGGEQGAWNATTRTGEGRVRETAVIKFTSDGGRQVLNGEVIAREVESAPLNVRVDVDTDAGLRRVLRSAN